MSQSFGNFNSEEETVEEVSSNNKTFCTSPTNQRLGKFFVSWTESPLGLQFVYLRGVNWKLLMSFIMKICFVCLLITVNACIQNETPLWTQVYLNNVYKGMTCDN